MAGGSVSDVIDSKEDNNNNNHYYSSSLIPKLQFRKASSKAYWREELCMFEVIESKGQMWTTTGVIRGGKIFCYIEEILFMAEMGGVTVFLDENEETRLSLKDMYKMVESRGGSSSLHSFLAYKYLKSLGYVLIPPCTPWVTKTGQSCGDMWRMTTCTSSRSCGQSCVDDDQSCGDMWRTTATDDAGSAVGNDSRSEADTWRTATADAVGSADQLSGDTWQIGATDDAAITTVDNDNQSWVDMWRIVVTDISDATKTVGNESQSSSDTCTNTATCTPTDCGRSCEDGWKTATQSHGDRWTTVSTGNYMCKTAAAVPGESCGVVDTWRTDVGEGSQSDGDRWRMSGNQVRPIYKVFLPDGRFRKSCPGEPAFLLCLCTQQHPPPVYSTRDIEDAETLCPGVPLKLCRVDSGHLSFFSFPNSPLPILP